MSTTPETPTPETDEHSDRMDNEDFDVELALTYDLARRLERERDAARAEIEAMREAIQEAHKIIEVLYMDALDSHKESWPRANEWLQKHAAFAKLRPFIPDATPPKP